MADDSDDEKTEEPSQYKIDESRKKGEVAVSKELSSVVLLSGSLLFTNNSLIILTGFIAWILSISTKLRSFRM